MKDKNIYAALGGGNEKKSPFSASGRERERNQEVLSQGAEAKILFDEKEKLIIKDRIKKSYRIKEIDDKIRKSRTKKEIKLLEKASPIINSPKPIPIENIYRIKMPFIKGEKLSENLDSFSIKKQKEICKIMGEEIAKLHEKDIIHGDLTTSNMILAENKYNDKPNTKKRGDFPLGGRAISRVIHIQRGRKFGGPILWLLNHRYVEIIKKIYKTGKAN